MRWITSSVLMLLWLPSLVAAESVVRTSLPGPDRFELQTALPIPRSQLLPILEAPCHVRQWMPGIETLSILDRPTATQTLVYMARKAPWPLSGRDAVTLFERHPGEPLVLTMSGQPEAWPEQPGHVRVPYTEGSWTLHDEGSTTRVVYQQQVDPGGGIPQWLADRLAPGQMEAALTALESYVRDPHRKDCTAADAPVGTGGAGEH